MMKDSNRLLDVTGPIGLAILLVGIALGSLVLDWTAIPFVVMGVGAALVITWIATHQSLIAEIVGLRSTQTNANAVISIAAVFAILVVINTFATRFDKTFDLTEQGLFTFSPQTVKVVENLSQPVKIWAVTESPDPSLREELERYKALNPQNLDFEFLNPRTSPAQAQQLDVTRASVLILTSGERRQEVPQTAVAELESTLTPALLQVTDTESLRVYFLEGHGEIAYSAATPDTPSLSQAVSGLESEGYTTASLNLIQEESVPEDAGALVIAGPTREFLPGEVDSVIDYLDRGGKVLLMLNPQTDPGLDELLDNWGVEVADNLIVDQLSEAFFRSGPFVALGASYGSHPITQDLATQQIPALFPLARSVSFTQTDDTTTTILVSTSPQGTWGETSFDLNNPDTQDLQLDPAQDQGGPLDIALAASRPVESDSGDSVVESEEVEETGDALTEESEAEEGATEARLVVFGNANFAVNQNFGQQGNGDLFLNSVNWLTERSDQISIRPKSPTNRRLQLQPTSLRYVIFIASLALPALAFASGIAVWWQRR